jgi:hypothetical protein
MVRVENVRRGKVNRARTHTHTHTHTHIYFAKIFSLNISQYLLLIQKSPRPLGSNPAGKGVWMSLVVRLITHAEKSCVNEEAPKHQGLSHQIK